MSLEKKKIDKYIKKYFKNFSKKNLSELSKMFSNDIVLIDWNVSVRGKKAVLEVNRKIFKNKGIIIKHEETCYDFVKKIAACKIQVIINKKKLNVLDLIYFNQKMEIKKIIAYLR